MKLPALAPATYPELGVVIQSDMPAYLVPPAGKPSREATYEAAMYALAMERAFRDLDEGPLNEMTDEQYEVALWVRNYLLTSAGKQMNKWQPEANTKD